MHCYAKLSYHNLIPPKPLLAHSTSPPPIFNSICRRDFASSSLLSLIITTSHPLRAETINKNENTPSINCVDPSPSPTNQEAFLDISIDGEPIGRITIGLYSNNVPLGAARFAKLVSGTAGASYRRKAFVRIMPNYVQHGGLRSSNFGAESLLNEWERNNSCEQGTKNVAKSVSIIVRDPFKPPPKTKLVARKGKLEIDEEEMGIDPNGTEFVIVTRDSPELDASALVVGTVVDGMDVVQRIAQIKTVQENSTSPYFRVAKLIGDKRAVVAERGFNRPYAKVVVTNCGLMG